MRRVIIESPYSGDTERNVTYARRCLLDSLSRGEAPFASHLLYTQVLDDSKPSERLLGMESGSAWYQVADAVIVYRDFGISAGMRIGIQLAGKLGRPVEYREVGNG